MSKLLFRMRGVPEDEADDVRELLSQHNIDYFETFAGNWGISMPAIWVRNDAQLDQAKKLLEAYQNERALRVRREYELNKERGEIKTLWHSFREDPVRFLAYIGLACAVLYLSVSFFVTL